MRRSGSVLLIFFDAKFLFTSEFFSFLFPLFFVSPDSRNVELLRCRVLTVVVFVANSIILLLLLFRSRDSADAEIEVPSVENPEL